MTTQDESSSNMQVVGRGVAELPIPKRIRVLYFIILFGFFFFVITFGLFLSNWKFLSSGFNTLVALVGALIVTIAFGLSIYLVRSGFVRNILKIRKKRAGEDWVFADYKDSMEAAKPIGLVVLLYGFSFIFVYKMLESCPLPREINRTLYRVSTGYSQETLPVFFWDYSTMIEPKWLAERDIIIPYEKGPPEKLLSKVIFRNVKTKQVELELNGRRPRSYPQDKVNELFNQASNSAATTQARRSVIWSPSFYPLLYALTKEAGLASLSTRPDQFYMIDYDNGTKLIGIPWEELLSGASKSIAGRFFFWGPDGSVFQVRCFEPCQAQDLLTRVQFPSDPRGSSEQRKQFTKNHIQKLLAFLSTPNRPPLFEKQLLLYLVSYLTLDPRDAEAYFHIGKLAHTRDTVTSMIKYARDVKMEGAKVAELEATLNTIKD